MGALSEEAIILARSDVMNGEEKQEILLESGTNEMEIIEFYVGRQAFGINVQKLKEIILFDESTLTSIPGSNFPLRSLKKI